MWQITKRTVALTALLVAIGCGKRDFVPVHGTVTYQGQPVDAGMISFRPLADGSGPVSCATIKDGHYELKARGGVPVGKHRVEVLAQKRTGGKVTEASKVGTPLVLDELVRVGPADYTGPNSPLTFDATSGGDGRFDIEIPRVDTPTTSR
jgi:hypothetical protein